MAVDPEGWTVGRRAQVVVALAAALALSAFAPHASAYAKSVALFAYAVVPAPVQPLDWVTRAPTVGMVEWEGGGLGQLTLPGGDSSVPGIVLLLGANPAEPDDPRVVRLTEGLARLGFAVLLPLSEDLDDDRVLPSEVPRLVGAFEVLGAQPRLEGRGIGFAGLSAGGSLVLVAAAQPPIAESVRFVVAIGPYYDAAALVASTAAAAHRLPSGAIEVWEPHETTVDVVTATLGALAADRRLDQLLDAQSLEEAEALLAGLEERDLAALAAISPRDNLDGLSAPLFLVHDREDPFVPWTQSEALADAATPAVYHRIDLFEHVEPAPGNVGVLLRDGWRFIRLFATVFEIAEGGDG